MAHCKTPNPSYPLVFIIDSQSKIEEHIDWIDQINERNIIGVGIGSRQNLLRALNLIYDKTKNYRFLSFSVSMLPPPFANTDEYMTLLNENNLNLSSATIYHFNTRTLLRFVEDPERSIFLDLINSLYFWMEELVTAARNRIKFF